MPCAFMHVFMWESSHQCVHTSVCAHVFVKETQPTGSDSCELMGVQDRFIIAQGFKHE